MSRGGYVLEETEARHCADTCSILPTLSPAPFRRKNMHPVRPAQLCASARLSGLGVLILLLAACQTASMQKSAPDNSAAQADALIPDYTAALQSNPGDYIAFLKAWFKDTRRGDRFSADRALRLCGRRQDGRPRGRKIDLRQRSVLHPERRQDQPEDGWAHLHRRRRQGSFPGCRCRYSMPRPSSPATLQFTGESAAWIVALERGAPRATTAASSIRCRATVSAGNVLLSSGESFDVVRFGRLVGAGFLRAEDARARADLLERRGQRQMDARWHERHRARRRAVRGDRQGLAPGNTLVRLLPTDDNQLQAEPLSSRRAVPLRLPGPEEQAAASGPRARRCPDPADQHFAPSRPSTAAARSRRASTRRSARPSAKRWWRTRARPRPPSARRPTPSISTIPSCARTGSDRPRRPLCAHPVRGPAARRRHRVHASTWCARVPAGSRDRQGERRRADPGQDAAAVPGPRGTRALVRLQRRAALIRGPHAAPLTRRAAATDVSKVAVHERQRPRLHRCSALSPARCWWRAIASRPSRRRHAPVASDGACVVDGNGATLMPGLVESHAHLSFTDIRQGTDLGNTPPEEHTLLTAGYARVLLEHGFTSCVSAASAKPRLDIAVRNAIDAGDIPGPRLLAASPELTVTSGLGDARLWHMHQESFAVVCDGPDGFRRYAREMCREGVDTLKINPSGDTLLPRARSAQTVMTEDEVAGGVRRGPRARAPRGGPRPQRRVGQAVSAPRRADHLPRQPGGRRSARPARSAQGTKCSSRRPWAGPWRCSNAAPNSAAFANADERATLEERAGGHGREHARPQAARRARAARRGLRIRLEPERHQRPRPGALRQAAGLLADGGDPGSDQAQAGR